MVIPMTCRRYSYLIENWKSHVATTCRRYRWYLYHQHVVAIGGTYPDDMPLLHIIIKTLFIFFSKIIPDRTSNDNMLWGNLSRRLF